MNKTDEFATMLAIIKKLEPVIEWKSKRGAGACMHDILTTAEFSKLNVQIQGLLARIEDDEGRIWDEIGNGPFP